MVQPDALVHCRMDTACTGHQLLPTITAGGRRRRAAIWKCICTDWRPPPRHQQTDPVCITCEAAAPPSAGTWCARVTGASRCHVHLPLQPAGQRLDITPPRTMCSRVTPHLQAYLAASASAHVLLPRLYLSQHRWGTCCRAAASTWGDTLTHRSSGRRPRTSQPAAATQFLTSSTSRCTREGSHGGSGRSST